MQNKQNMYTNTRTSKQNCIRTMQLYGIIKPVESSIPDAVLTFRHCASCILGQAFHYSPENAFYIFNQQIYFII